MKERRYDIDWLRVIAMRGVFVKRSGFMRFLFGMAPRKKPTASKGSV